VALGIAAQLVESIRQKAEAGIPSSTSGGKQAQTEPQAVIRWDRWRKIRITLHV
jgi:hypothetical protein